MLRDQPQTFQFSQLDQAKVDRAGSLSQGPSYKNGLEVCIGVKGRHRGPLSPRNEQYVLLEPRREEREKAMARFNFTRQEKEGRENRGST